MSQIQGVGRQPKPIPLEDSCFLQVFQFGGIAFGISVVVFLSEQSCRSATPALKLYSTQKWTYPDFFHISFNNVYTSTMSCSHLYSHYAHPCCQKAPGYDELSIWNNIGEATRKLQENFANELWLVNAITEDLFGDWFFTLSHFRNRWKGVTQYEHTFCALVSLLCNSISSFGWCYLFLERPHNYGDIEENSNFGGDSAVPL